MTFKIEDKTAILYSTDNVKLKEPHCHISSFKILALAGFVIVVPCNIDMN